MDEIRKAKLAMELAAIDVEEATAETVRASTIRALEIYHKRAIEYDALCVKKMASGVRMAARVVGIIAGVVVVLTIVAVLSTP